MNIENVMESRENGIYKLLYYTIMQYSKNPLVN